MQHHNAITGTVYQGGNVTELELSRIANSFQSYEWATFLQWKMSGYSVKKGARGSHILFFAETTKIEKTKDGKTRAVAGHAPRCYTVFNRDQVEKTKVKQPVTQ